MSHPATDATTPRTTTSRPAAETGTEEDLPLLAAPVVIIAALAVKSPVLALLSAFAALAAGLLAHRITHAPSLSFLAAGFAAAILHSPTLAIVAIAVLIPAILTEEIGHPWFFLLGAVGLAWDAPGGHLIVAASATLLAGSTLTMLPHARARTWGGPILASLIAALSMILGAPVWLATGGILGALIGRYLNAHPANARIGETLARTGLWVLPVPALTFMVLAAVDRLDPLDPVPLLLVAWGTVGLGITLFLLLLGYGLTLRSPSEWSQRWAGIGGLVAVGLPAYATQGQLRLGFGVLAVGMAILAVPAALGAWRLLVPFGRLRVFGAMMMALIPVSLLLLQLL